MSVLLIHGNSSRIPLSDKCIDLTVTSPPYGDLRAYNGYDFDRIKKFTIDKGLYYIEYESEYMTSYLFRIRPQVVTLQDLIDYQEWCDSNPVMRLDSLNIYQHMGGDLYRASKVETEIPRQSTFNGFIEWMEGKR